MIKLLVSKIIIFAFFLLPNVIFAQKIGSKNTISLGLHHVILGEGDYNGFAITNHYSRQFLSFFEFSPSLGYISSHKQSDIGFIETYLANHLTFDLPVNVVPVNAKYFFLKIGGGGLIRLRKEVWSIGRFYDNTGIIEEVILKESTWDKGYSIQVALGTNIGQKASISAKMSLQNYNQGTQVVMFGLIGSYKL
ncbi:MAG: hypothetical protein IPN76_23330 [Saprospiraceae bacterium]|nr:hypothetical protein [Saprospiraceae bacterium]